MSVLFYRRAADAPPAEAAGLPPGLVLRSWRPAVDGPPRRRDGLWQDLAWFAFQRAGLFASGDFEELSIWRGERMLHRMVVTPRWLRFPFMADGDLQLGGLWTDPEVRRIGLASLSIAEAHRRHAAPGRRFWYVVEEANLASVALAKTCGYHLIGTGRRTRPLGLAALGQFRLESAAIPATPSAG